MGTKVGRVRYHSVRDASAANSRVSSYCGQSVVSQHAYLCVRVNYKQGGQSLVKILLELSSFFTTFTRGL